MNALKKAIFAVVIAASPLAMAASANASVTGQTLSQFWTSLITSTPDWWTLADSGDKAYDGTYTIYGQLASIGAGITAQANLVYGWTLSITKNVTPTEVTYSAIGSQEKYAQTIYTYGGIQTPVSTAPEVSGSVNLTQSFAVPGPIVGAGVPMLLAGFAAWGMLRRRQTVG